MICFTDRKDNHIFVNTKLFLLFYFKAIMVIFENRTKIKNIYKCFIL